MKYLKCDKKIVILNTHSAVWDPGYIISWILHQCLRHFAGQRFAGPGFSEWRAIALS